MNVYAFDADDTLEGLNGPVKLSQVLALKNAGHVTGLCGNWGRVTTGLKGWQHLFSFIGPFGGMTKVIMLVNLKLYIPADHYIMIGNVSPSTDQLFAEQAGWEFVKESDFKEGLPVSAPPSVPAA